MEAQARENSIQVRNDFKPFATGEGANVVDQLEYEKSGFLKEGFKKGMARSSEINKAIRQGSSIAAAVARFAAEKTGEDIFDNGDIGALSRQIETAISSVSSLLIADADGLPDALIARFTPKVKELKHGLPVHVRAKDINVTVIPTFNADETGAKAIVKGNNLPLAIGDIAGAGHWLEMQYDEALDKWILQNPAKGISPSSGVPVGTIEYFASAIPPAGYLKADGVAVGRTTYPELFAAIGTAFGEGDESTTFNLPDLIDRFAQRSSTPGLKIEAGLPNIKGTFGADTIIVDKGVSGAFTRELVQSYPLEPGGGGNAVYDFSLDASRFSPIYGASSTVQPPALTLLPCIKAFDAATNPGLINITGLANEISNKADRDFTNVNDPAQAFKNASIAWGIPDYNAGISITVNTLKNGFTAPSDGIFCCRGWSSTIVSVVKVNEKFVSAIGGGSTAGVVAFLSAGDVLTTSIDLTDYEGYFYKFKGAI
ncbi:phage tail protein [uncultured Oxalobacter sp.]|uniref:phage tail protein n=1 Tax=uncultured Oxalobacter sp. TaxID=337245 RepID=UPI0025940194|nr:phage tail protein [uncultured Oxalobacter sp.]